MREKEIEEMKEDEIEQFEKELGSDIIEFHPHLTFLRLKRKKWNFESKELLEDIKVKKVVEEGENKD